jgi:predicted RNase H-like nuclease (RuvC/YqgF family)
MVKKENSIKMKIDTISKDLFSLYELIEDELNSKTEEINTQMRELENKMKIIKLENTNLLSMNEYLQKDKDKLEKHILNIEEEHRDLMKVSKIIALENENAKLKTEVSMLKDKINSLKVETTNPIIIPKKTTDERHIEEPFVKPIEMSDETDIDIEKNNINFTEKKIGNIIYYIDDNKKVFVKNDDDTIGEEIGYLKKANGRTKLIKNK